MKRGAIHEAARAVVGLVPGLSVLVEPAEQGRLEISVSGTEDLSPIQLTPQAWATAVREALSECALSDLRARRRALGLTQTQLAQRAGVHVETLSEVELGRTVPRSDTLAAIQGALDRFTRERSVCAEPAR